MLSQTIEEFGRRLGLASLALNGRGTAALRLGDLGTFTLEAQGDELWATLSRPASHEEERLKSLLEAVGWRRRPPFPVHAALFREQFLLSARFPAETVTAAEIEGALRFMSGTLSKALAR